MEPSVQCCLPSFPNPARTKVRTVAAERVHLPDYDLDTLTSANTTAAAIDALLIKAWALVLRCYIGSDDICFGYQREGEDESLLCHIRITDDDQLPELRQRELPFTRTEEQFDFSSWNCLFLRKTEREDDESSSETLPEPCRVRFGIEDYFGRPSLTLEYWRDEMSSSHVACIAQVLSEIISQLLTHDDRQVKDLDFFTPQDSRRVAKWNTSMPPTRDSLIHDIVQQQCRKWPVKEAICAWDGSFTFSEFDSVTSRLASYLQHQGVGPETMVPLCFEKTVSGKSGNCVGYDEADSCSTEMVHYRCLCGIEGRWCIRTIGPFTPRIAFAITYQQGGSQDCLDFLRTTVEAGTYHIVTGHRYR